MSGLSWSWLALALSDMGEASGSCPQKSPLWLLCYENLAAQTQYNIQILLPSQALSAAQSSIQCSCVQNQQTILPKISTLLHSLQPQCPRPTPFPKARVSITRHILAKRDDLLSRKLRHCELVLGLRDQKSSEGTDWPRWSPVTEGKDKSCERAAWPKRHLLVLLGISSPYPDSASLHLCTANCCCCSSSLEQSGRNLD